MKGVIVVTDSSATVPVKLQQELDIRVVPMIIALDGHSFRDGEQITSVDVYHWLRDGRHSPTTASPSIGDFLRVYYAAAQQASAIVSIHLSPKLSATYSVAKAASQLIENVPVHVVDSRTAAMAQGFVVIEAARAAAGGADLEEVVAHAEEVAAKVNLFATLDTLEYLYRGGRIGGAAALAGAILQIKPVLYLADGQVGVVAKPRTRTKAIHAMLEHMAEQVDGHRLHAAVLHADVPEEAQSLRQRMAERFDCAELYIAELTPMMGVHTGPGVLGVVFYPE
jgi:DegV family protein with EDD domain